jgi:predicted Zn finger-like uncharacterized protein
MVPGQRNPARLTRSGVLVRQMSYSMQLGDRLQTRCTHCDSRFRVTLEQLDVARGRVRCSQCQQVFNALTHLDNYTADSYADGTVQKRIDSTMVQPPAGQTDTENSHSKSINPATKGEAFEPPEEAQTDTPVLSLDEAMYGGEEPPKSGPIRPLLWSVGILALLIVSIVQLVYYQRYHLIGSSQYQQQILGLCKLLPCDRSRFANPSQIRMLERHVFSHPTRNSALMVTGSFVNDAPFAQALPGMLISLSDINGRLIANREFDRREYLAGASQSHVLPGQTVQFRLEIIDPGEAALTYEFEFI